MNSTSLFTKPHTIAFLTVLLAILLKLSFLQYQNSVLLGLIASALVFLVVGVLQFQDGPFLRPHPFLWRAVLATSILYLMLLVFLLFQPLDSARRLVSHLDSSLGVPLPEKSYAEHCEFTWLNISSQLDFFIWAHAVGWYVKALILRDTWLCWILSVMFEVAEYSLQHQLPNFAECWWDHWILDVATCNWLGIWLGMKTCR